MNNSNVEDLRDEKALEPENLSMNGTIGNSQSEIFTCNESMNEKNIENNSSQNPGTSNSTLNSKNKPKKRKKILRDETAPKQPLTGYLRFLNDRRENVRNENPNKPFAEITRQLAAEWNVLASDQKQMYLDAAEQDKERYNKEFNDYKQTDAYKTFLSKQVQEKKKKLKKQKEKEKNVAENNTIRKTNKSETHGYDIPIFTEEFLDHNKACETELRQLRKTTADYESQNSVLKRHVESLHTAIQRLEGDTNNQKEVNLALEQHLQKLRNELSVVFAHIPLPGFSGATLKNVDSYVKYMSSKLTNIDSSLREKLKNAVCQIEIVK